MQVRARRRHRRQPQSHPSNPVRQLLRVPSSALQRLESHERLEPRPQVRREPLLREQRRPSLATCELAPLGVGAGERFELRESRKAAAEFDGDRPVVRDGDVGIGGRDRPADDALADTVDATPGDGAE